ncbi:hypothetical protein JCM8115_002999 [Rhodotorula mucilaginosa]
MVNVTYTPDGSMVVDYDPSLGADGVATYSTGDMALVITAAVLVMIMSPGIGFLYSGLLRRKNALSMIFLSLAIYSLVTIAWFFWGYSLTFAPNGSAFIGNLHNFGLMNVLGEPSVATSKIPGLLFAFFQLQFATVTACIAVGGAAERIRTGPLLLWIFCWTTIVYSPVAHWVWSPDGWAFTKLGDLDFAGGGPVHITSGTAGFMLAFFVGPRRGYGTAKLAFRPHSVSHVVLGTVFLWFGWFGFNAGSEGGMNLRTIQAAIVTQVAASMGGLTWAALDFIYTRKWSATSLCSGILAGLVGITPAAGYVGTPASLAIGFVTAVVANYATGIKILLKVDDAVDTFALHAIGGFTGACLTGLFADDRVTSFDGYSSGSGWINHHYIQLGYQLAGAVTIMAYTAVVSLILCYLINWIPGMHFRVSTDSEIVGMDESECGEYAYDFVSIRNEVHPGVSGEDGHTTAYGSTRAGSLVEPEHEKVPAGAGGGAHPAAPVPSPPASTSAASGTKA